MYKLCRLRQLIYINTFSRVCQPLFSSFFNFFFEAAFAVLFRLFETAYLYYHFFRYLSTLFLKKVYFFYSIDYCFLIIAS